MKKTELFRKVLSLLLAVTMLAGLALPAGAVTADSELRFELEQIDNSAVTAEPLNQMGTLNNSAETLKDPNEVVRVTIHLEKASTISAGFELKGIGTNVSAMSYRQKLESEQTALQNTIERQVLQGQKLDVVWNLTLAANLISANVPRWAISEIAGLKGVKSVTEENRYAPDVVSVGGEYTTDMAVSGQMTGATAAWLEGYTGAGSRVAVIDTGLDTDHQSFSPEALLHAIEQTGKTVSLMDSTDIAPVLTQLNAYKYMVSKGQTLSAHDLYFNAKTPYGFNYVDGDLDITHDNDGEGEHGSHVAGIAAANRYIEKNGLFVDALREVFVAGTAPDAQLLIMKVFGKDGGAYDSDIMASIEDAMVLGADSVNLSLGSVTAGASYDPNYTEMMNRVKASGMTVMASAGNDGPWSIYTTNGYLYNDGVNLDTVGTPGSFDGFMAVASVDNDGSIGSSIVVGDITYGYGETLSDPDTGYAYGNKTLSSLDYSLKGSGTEYEFVHIDGIGNPASYAGVEIAGKIAVCSRGTLYYYEKANYAAELGAVALLIYNNEPGMVYADLNGINYDMPVVTITQEAGAAIAAIGTEKTSAAGITYRTGTISIRSAMSGNYDNSAYKTMSSFSSFGVPGDLSLKPDITAPGGNIYSVNGAVSETDQYELMSGTSMAAPQVAGLAAVVKQYIRENGLSFEGLNERALTNALLMSTAQPIYSSEGIYYPVIQQGSGLADVNAAVNSPAFLTVDGIDDGFVKAELGDDPARTGVYTFSFKLNNLYGEAVSYTLSADAFTQDIFSDDQGHNYMDVLTRNMQIDTRFVVDGNVLSAANSDSLYDFNGDGAVTRSDAQALLDHVTLGTELAANADKADLNGDGLINTYDVHLFLKNGQSAVEVPAHGSVTVEVTLTLTGAERAQLDRENPAGAYVQAFVKATPATTDDGELLPTLSLPVLAYYGDWSDPSMYDVGTQVTFATGEETRSSYLNNTYGNAMGIIYGDRPYEVWYFGGNPIVPDTKYIPERNAINTERGDYFYQWAYAPIRTAEASRLQAMNTTTGEVWIDRVGGPVGAAFYYYAYQSWMDTPQYAEIELAPDLEVGEYGLLKLTLATEYHVVDGQVDWDSLGKGATMEMPFTVDNEAPEILDVVVDTNRNVMRVTATDDQYLAGVVLYDVTGNRRLSYAGTTANAKSGDTITFEIPLNGVNGYKFIIQTSDYAANMATYEIRHTIGDPMPLPDRIAFDENFGSWATFFQQGYYWNTAEWFKSDIRISAATAIGEYALAVDASDKLYVIPVEDMLDEIFICKLPVTLTDMAYDASTDTVYGITADSRLFTVDKYTGETQQIGTVGIETSTLANDGDGTFYCMNFVDTGAGNYYTRYRYDLYAFNLDENGAPTEPTLVGNPYSGSSNPLTPSTLEYDPLNNIVCLLARLSNYSYDYSYYFEFDPITGESLITDYYPPMPFTKAASGLIFPQWGEHWGDWAAAAEQPTSVSFAKEEVEVLLGLTAQVSATAMPWNLSNKDVIFTSADESIATVSNKGVVTGVGLGTTTLRATSVADNTVYGECKVTVKLLDVTVSGVLMDEIGTPMFYSWNMADDEGLHRGDAIEYGPMALTRVPGTDTFYLLDSRRGTMHLLDAQGKDLVTPSDEYYQQNFWIWDLAYSEYFSDNAPSAIGIRENAVVAPFDLMDPNFINFDMGRYGVSFLAGIASAGYEKITYQDWYGYDAEADSELFFMVDESGNIWRINMFQDMGSWDMLMSKFSSDLNIHFPVGFDGRSSLVIGEDNALYFSAFNGKSSDLYRLVYDDVAEMYLSTFLGNFGKDVWPAAILDVTSNAPAEKIAPMGTTRYNDTTVSGSLNAISVELGDETATGIVVDAENGTVTVPVNAIDSTNGLFELTYDPAVLTLTEVKSGAAMTSVDTAAEGTVRVGYAAAAELNAAVATLVFSINAESDTELTLTTLEDGSSTTVSSEKLPVVLGHVCPSEHFVDVNEGNWWHEPVDYVVSKGFMNGMDATHFGPSKTMNRAQFVTVLYRMEGEPAVNNTGVFTDVPAGQFYTDAAYWALEAGITTGATASTFKPNGKLTRTELVTFMYRYAKYKGYDTTSGDLSTFKDADKVLSYAVEPWSWAVHQGIVTGMTADTLAPMNLTNRAQAAVIFQRFDTKLAN